MTFTKSSAVRSLGDGTFTASLPAEWTVGPKPHGGFLLAVMTRAAALVGDGDPLAVSALFLRAPEVGWGRRDLKRAAVMLGGAGVSAAGGFSLAKTKKYTSPAVSSRAPTAR